MTDPVARFLFILAHAVFSAFVLALAYVNWRRAPKSGFKASWIGFCIAAALFALAVMVGGLADTPRSAFLWVRIGVSLGCVGTWLFYLFSICYSTLRRNTSRFLIWFGAIWTALLVVLFWCSDLIVAGVTSSEVSRFAPVGGTLMPLYGAWVLYGWLFSCVLFVRNLLRSQGVQRIQAAYMLLAFGAGLIGSLGSILPSLLGVQTIWLYLPQFFFPLLPLLITFSIIRHRLWDIQTIFFKTAVWLSLLLLLAFPLYLAIWFAAQYLPAPSALGATIGLSLLFLLSYFYLTNIKPKLDHLFQRRRYDRRAVLDAFDLKMSSLDKPKSVASYLLDTIQESLYPQQAAVSFHEEEGGGWSSIQWSASESDEDMAMAPDHAFLRQLVPSGRVLDRSTIDTDPSFTAARDLARQFFEETGCQLCLPLASGGQLMAIVGLGAKRNLRPYSLEDFEFIEQLGAAAAIGLTNAMLFERVDHQRRDLEDMTDHLEERVEERTRELNTANEMLRDAYIKLRELDRLKSQLFANINHELRTPLSLILAPLDSMLDGDLGHFDELQMRHLRSMHRNSLRLHRMIDDLLDLSRLEESRLELKKRPVNLAGIVGRMVDTARSMAERKGISIALDRQAEPEVEADEEKIEKVIVNLLSNALKFTLPGGEVRLVVCAQDGEACVEVRDNGIGIPASELESIFDRFHQVDGGTNRSFRGSGLGLALARELAEMHGGRIEVESELGAGSVFRLLLPGRQGADGEVDRAIEEPAKEGLPEWTDQLQARPDYRYLAIDEATERRVVLRDEDHFAREARLLVVDDNADMLRYLHQVLGERYDVWTVQDAGRALELLERERHELVIADVMMPGISGLELCHRIKSNPRLQQTPVLLLTARTGEAHRIEGHSVGADQYVTKPFRPAELMAIISGMLAGRARMSEVAARRRSDSLETLMAGLAHELRNACHQAKNAQTASMSLVRKLNGENCAEEHARVAGQLETMSGIIERALDRISAVVLSLQRFAGQYQPAPWKEIDLDAMVRRELGRLTLAELKDARLSIDLQSGARVRGSEEELRQLVINLAENAAHAVRPGGTIEVKTRAQPGKVLLSVRDDGAGIAPEDRERIFDLYYSTRSEGEGSGLGLALCKRTASDMGGSISLSSELGKGSEFTVELPIAELDAGERRQ
ncbi:MAG: response regulator [Deltaproteobacteria bacterium]|nr:response regulator [Deltaproteobacteria bacterium]